jgi:hypothetical protein
MFARDLAKPSVDLSKTSPSPGESSGAPSNPAGAEPIDEVPSNKVFILSLLEGYEADEVEAMEIDMALHAEDWRSKYLT